jgi:hypothetical protein
MQRFKFRLLPALAAAALALSACESTKSINAPAPAAADKSAFHTAPVGKVVVRAPGAFSTLDMSSSAVIGSAGGTLVAGAARLVVPAGAVPDGTIFTMNVSSTNIFQVSLTASSSLAPGTNNVGAAGFSTPVLLYYDFGAPPPEQYSVAWQVVNGVLVSVPSRIEGNFVIGQLSHFTEYVLQDSEYHWAE